MAVKIFDGNISGTCASMMMVFMLLFAMFFEWLTNLVQRKMAKRRAYAEMLTKVYKELMILGFIAFSVILAKEAGYTMGARKLHCFEFCDMLVSICVLVYIGQTAISSFAMHRTRRVWDRISLAPVNLVCSQLGDMITEFEASSWAKCAVHFSASRFYRMRDDADFKIVELIFKTEFHLPHNFDYVSYTKAVLEANIIDSANITVSHWCGLSLICGFMYFVIDKLQMCDHPPCYSEQWCMWCHTEADSEETGVWEQFGMGRRRLSAEVSDLSCNFLTCADGIGANGTVNQTGLHQKFDTLLGNSSNSFMSLADTCQCAELYPVNTQRAEADDELVLLVWLTSLVGLFLMVTQYRIVHFLRHKMRMILKYSGAKENRDVVPLITRLGEKQLTNAPRPTEEGDSPLGGSNPGNLGKGRRQKTIIHLDEIDEQTSKEAGGFLATYVDTEGQKDADRPVLHFSDDRNGKTSRDVMRPRTIRAIMWISKFIQLINCFYMGFYVCHVQIVVNRAEWYLFQNQGSFMEGFGDAISWTFVHVCLTLPSVYIGWELLPATIRHISMVGGVLYLNENAVIEVLADTEHIHLMRDRITKTLLDSNFTKGKPNVLDGRKYLQKVQTGEFAILQEINTRARQIEARITRAEMMELLERQKKKHTEMASIADFLSRAAHARLIDEAQNDIVGEENLIATLDTATTLELDDSNKNMDSILVSEFQVFIVRAVADAVNIASEHGVLQAELSRFEDDLIGPTQVTREQFEQNRLQMRARAMFEVCDKDHSGGVSAGEMYQAVRKFRVPMKERDVEQLMRVIDPDQSGRISLDEWMAFMLGNVEDINMRAITARENRSRLSAQQNTLSDFKKMQKDLVGLTLDITVGTVTAVTKGVTDLTDEITQDITELEHSVEHTAIRALDAVEHTLEDALDSSINTVDTLIHSTPNPAHRHPSKSPPGK